MEGKIEKEVQNKKYITNIWSVLNNNKNQASTFTVLKNLIYFWQDKWLESSSISVFITSMGWEEMIRWICCVKVTGSHVMS